MFELFKLIGRILVDNSGANKSLTETDQKAQGVTGKLGGYMDKLKGWAAAAGAAIGGSAIAKSLKEVWDISSQVADIGDDVDKSAQKFMLSRKAYQEWAYVAERSGTSIDKIGDAIEKLTVDIGEGKESSLAVLEELGISAAEAMTATPEELFDMVITGLQGVDASTRRAYLADELFGGAARDLNPLLNTSAEETRNLKDEVEKLGGVMSDQLVDQSAKFKDSQTNLQTAWDGVKYHLAENTLPGMTQIIDGLTQMLTGDFAEGLKIAGDGVVEYLGGLLSTFEEWAGKARESIEAAIGIDLAPILDNPVFNPFSIPNADERNNQFWDDVYSKYSNSGQTDNSKTSLFDNKFSFGIGGYTYGFGHANGIEFVPRNNYPATLHYGERVLTRQEAEEYNAGKASGGDITINITTTQQSPAQTAAAITAALTRARWAM